MTKSRDIANSTSTLDVDGGTIKLDGNYPVGTNNVALGDAALDSNVSGGYNTAAGAFALTSNTIGNANTAVGYQALLDNTTGAANTSLGYLSLANNTTAEKNVAVGVETLETNTTGQYNTALGTHALRLNTTAGNNTAVGYQAGYANTTGVNNTAIGADAGKSITTAASNTMVGHGAGQNTNSDKNTFIGRTAGYNVTSGAKNTIIGRFNGNENGLDIRTSSNHIVLSDGDGNPRVVVDPNGDLLVGVTATNHLANANAVQLNQGDYGQIYVNHVSGTQNGIYYISFSLGGSDIGSIRQANGTSVNYLTSSDYRLKENVEDISDSITRVKQLQPRRFNFTIEPDITCDGFLAHEVSTVVPEAVSGEKDEVQVWDAREERPDGVSVGDNKLDEDGNTIIKPQGIDHSKLVPLLTAAIQELSAKNDALEARIATLEG